jgi:sec-independent protein translocase protein TatA
MLSAPGYGGGHRRLVMGLSGYHLVIILVIVLVIFGPGKLGGIGKSLGTAISEFKNAMSPEEKKDEEKPVDKLEDKKDA